MVCLRPSFPTWILLPLLACGGGAGKKGEELCDDGTPKKTWYADNDRDGFGNENTATRACSAPEGWILVAGDCDDGRTAVNPDMPEICDEGGVDEDCDGLAGDADAEGAQGALEGYVDADGDGFGELGSELIAVCGYGDGRADNAEDCDDSDASTFPGSAYREDPSLCMEDGDGDGWGNPYPTGNGAPGNDCDDTNPDVFPGAVSYTHLTLPTICSV